MPDQLSLYDPPIRRPPGGLGFLASLATIFDHLADTPALHRICVQAAAATAGPSGNRGAGEDFEQALAELLTDDVQAEISAATISTLDAGRLAFPPLDAIVWRYCDRDGGGRSAADFEVELQFDDGTLLYVPVNVKRKRSGPVSGDDAVNIRTLLRVALGRPWAGRSKIDVPRTLLRWLARRERIRPGDYMLLLVTGDPTAGTVDAVRCQGLLSAVDADGQLAVRRHSNREIALYTDSVGILPDDLDVNLAFAEQLAGRPDGSQVRLAVVTWVAAMLEQSADERAARAAALDDAADLRLAQELDAAIRRTTD